MPCVQTRFFLRMSPAGLTSREASPRPHRSLGESGTPGSAARLWMMSPARDACRKQQSPLNQRSDAYSDDTGGDGCDATLARAFSAKLEAAEPPSQANNKRRNQQDVHVPRPSPHPSTELSSASSRRYCNEPEAIRAVFATSTAYSRLPLPLSTYSSNCLAFFWSRPSCKTWLPS